MKRTTIFIDEALERDLRAIAERQRQPVSGLVREALGAYIAGRKREGARLGFVAFGRSGRRDTSERHEELLWPDGGEGASRPVRRRAHGDNPAASSPAGASRKKRG